MPPRDPTRRFTLADLSIVIAGLAVALGLMRTIPLRRTVGEVWQLIVRPPFGWSMPYLIELGFGLAILLALILAGWTPACLALQIRQPRARWRQLRRQPGFVACLVATGVVVVTLAATMLGASLEWLDDRTAPRVPLPLGVELAGLGVLVSWVAMRLCGVCRPRPTWTDRLGRITGIVWITLGVAATVFLVWFLKRL